MNGGGPTHDEILNAAGLTEIEARFAVDLANMFSNMIVEKMCSWPPEVKVLIRPKAIVAGVALTLAKLHADERETCAYLDGSKG
jgi:hypothetical protein